MRWLLLSAFLIMLPVGATAQDSGAGLVTVETHTERPPEGSLRRGYVPVPAWALYVGAGALALAACGALVWRMRRSRDS